MVPALQTTIGTGHLDIFQNNNFIIDLQLALTQSRHLFTSKENPIATETNGFMYQHEYHKHFTNIVSVDELSKQFH